MKNIGQKIEDIERKISRLVDRYSKVEEENLKLRTEKQDMLDIIDQHKVEIEKLNNDKRIVKLAKTLSETDEDTVDLKVKISKYVREIDKCLTLLAD
ncbi:MAG: chromosome segregation ATPase [Sphingobacteriales bacterium]|jgi:chromosome segregation ATPase